MREFFRENWASIKFETWGIVWWCRCKLAARTADVVWCLAHYCRWRGEGAWLARWFAKRLERVAVRILPPVLRPIIGE